MKVYPQTMVKCMILWYERKEQDILTDVLYQMGHFLFILSSAIDLGRKVWIYSKNWFILGQKILLMMWVCFKVITGYWIRLWLFAVFLLKNAIEMIDWFNIQSSDEEYPVKITPTPLDVRAPIQNRISIRNLDEQE